MTKAEHSALALHAFPALICTDSLAPRHACQKYPAHCASCFALNSSCSASEDAHNLFVLVQEIANDILSEQTPKRLFAVRGKLYELLINCIPPELILKKLMLELVRKLDDELKHKVADCAAFFEHRLQVCAAFTCFVSHEPRDEPRMGTSVCSTC